MRKPESIVILGSILVVFAATLATVLWPMYTMSTASSEIWRPTTSMELQGRQHFIGNGCTYCHSQYIRPQDWGIGAQRIAQEGDYKEQRPHLLGSQRTGPDLSQEGGEHSNDWHLAHFINPRYTRPRSLMPSFEYLGREHLAHLTMYLQSLGGKSADARMAVQNNFRKEVLAAYLRGPDENVRYLHSRVPQSWRPMKSANPAIEASLARGEKVYQDYCVGCHGPLGDGNGPAAPYLIPSPINFTTLKRHLIDGKFIGGIIYYQVMNGITGSSMPYFKKDLESSKIWDVGNFVATYYINYSDDQIKTPGIPASFEGNDAAPWTPNPEPGPLPPGSGAVR